MRTVSVHDLPRLGSSAWALVCAHCLTTIVCVSAARGKYTRSRQVGDRPMLMTINPAKNDASYNWVNSNPGNQGPFVSGVLHSERGTALRRGEFGQIVHLAPPRVKQKMDLCSGSRTRSAGGSGVGGTEKRAIDSRGSGNRLASLLISPRKNHNEGVDSSRRRRSAVLYSLSRDGCSESGWG